MYFALVWKGITITFQKSTFGFLPIVKTSSIDSNPGVDFAKVCSVE